MAFIVLMLAIIAFMNIYIVQFSKDKLYNDISSIPKNKVGLVLGTSQYLRGGGTNPFFSNRVEAAVDLFNAGKIEFILVSGDNRHISYNEPRDLKKALVKRGIPEDRIVLDFAGFRTLDSVIRSKKVFGQNSITIISQKFHNERAIYLAYHNNLPAVAFNAKDPDSHSGRVYWRELLARPKAFLDILIKTPPKFLGEPIEIKVKEVASDTL